MVFCQRCGNTNVDEAKFCVNCGEEIKRIDKQKQQEQNATSKQTKKTIQPRRQSLKPFKINAAILATLLAVSAVIGFSIGFFISNEFFPENGSINNGIVENAVTLSVQEFFDILNFNVDNTNYSVYSDVMGLENGDILKIHGRINQLENNYEEVIGEYTSLTLYYSNTTSLLINILGNISTQYDIGDYIVVTLHVIGCYGQYLDVYGITWNLYGEFMLEEFYYDKFFFDLIIPLNQVRKI